MAARPRLKEKGVTLPNGFTERRDGEKNRRADGWRWGAVRAERRRRPQPKSLPRPWKVREVYERYGGRRRHHRRQEDRDDG